MKILAIETSCDETAISILEADGGLESPHFVQLGNALLSQISTHTHMGGVVPSLAKREHSRNLIPLLGVALREASMEKKETADFLGNPENREKVSLLLEREPDLLAGVLEYLPTVARPEIDAIAVTYGPGLEPALWVGVNFAKALSLIWNIPVIPVNHMEGHIVSVLGIDSKEAIGFPALALLISGGHTELVLMENWFEYKLLGQTRDDAVGEAFDKAARMMGLPYPGGPQIGKLAKEARELALPQIFELPRPMLHADNFDFSFSGLKTAVLYQIKTLTENGAKELSLEQKQAIAREFENAAIEVLVKKTERAIEEYAPRSLILGGGVTASIKVREDFKTMTEEYPETKLYVPERSLSTDNAVMIGMAGYLRAISGKAPIDIDTLRANGNLAL